LFVIFLAKEETMGYWTQIASFIAGLAGGWTLKAVFDNSKNTTTIKGNKAGGDIAGRDINKK
jgi:hypothetical protein